MNIKKIIQLGLTSIFVIVTLLSNNALAQIGEKPVNPDHLLYKFSSGFTSDVTTTDYVSSLPQEESSGHILGQITYFLLIVANVLAFISLLIAGVFMVAAQGNEDDFTKAKKIFTYTIIAMVICAVALAIVSGVTKLNFFRP